MKNEKPTNTSPAVTLRRVPGVGACESAHPPSGGWDDFYPVGSGLRAALCRKVAAAEARVEAAWPLGLEREARNLVNYRREVRRYLRLRGGLVDTYGSFPVIGVGRSGLVILLGAVSEMERRAA